MNRIRIASIALFVSILFTTQIVPAQGVSKFDEHQEWVSKVIKEVQKIKVGMTRRELLTLFREEGGLSTGLQRTYVYQGCPYIKVDVEFLPVGRSATDSEGRVTLVENKDDLIRKISKPYLEFTIND